MASILAGEEGKLDAIQPHATLFFKSGPIQPGTWRSLQPGVGGGGGGGFWLGGR